jgi:hypothetical protein
MGLYEPLGTLITSQIPADPNNATSGLPELAAALGLLGNGEVSNDWVVDRANPSEIGNGTLLVTPNASVAQRVFFVANQGAALHLYVSEAISDDEPDVVLIYSSPIEQRASRSPRRLRRTTAPKTRRVGFRALLEQASDFGDLYRRFREEAVL